MAKQKRRVGVNGTNRAELLVKHFPHISRLVIFLVGGDLVFSGSPKNIAWTARALVAARLGLRGNLDVEGASFGTLECVFVHLRGVGQELLSRKAKFRGMTT